jgi:hypothetical protein
MPSAYLSHPIRGAKGDEATREDMEANNRQACEFAMKIRAAYPGLDLYCPGEHDELVQEGIEQDVLTAEQILEIDQYLVSKRNFLIVYAPDARLSGGMLLEIHTANRRGMPIVVTNGSLEVIGAVLETFIR